MRKILKALICKCVMSHLKTYNAWKFSQHGFMYDRSCLTNLLCVGWKSHCITWQRSQRCCFLSHYSKAFDRVPQQGLLAKLSAHKIKGKLHTLISSWLKKRKQRVVLNGSRSKWSNVSSGVPQGSTLGLLLFIISINDIDTAVDLVNWSLLKITDDTKGLRHVDNTFDVSQLQLYS